VALSLLTGVDGLRGLRAALMNYMAYYVAEVVRLTPVAPRRAALLGWHPWSVVRIVSFVILGVVLAEPLLRRLTGPRARSPAGRSSRWPGRARDRRVHQGRARPALGRAFLRGLR
jgi:hypothetical protein